MRLARSADPLERWEAANSLAYIDPKIADEIRTILAQDESALVRSVLHQVELPKKTRPRRPAEQASSPFLEAITQPLDPGARFELADKARAEAQRTLSDDSPLISRDTTFPQANSLESLMAMLDVISSRKAISGRALGISARQVGYYRDALRYVGLIEMTADVTISVHQNRLSCLKTARDKQEYVVLKLLQIRTVAAAYLRNEVVEDETRTSGPRTASEVLFIFEESGDSVGISGKTLKRRAQTAIAWADQIWKLLHVT
jgi:hypothetical protein